MQYLRERVPRITCNPGCAFPIFDIGFRGPGKAQFLAAMDNYKPELLLLWQSQSRSRKGPTQVRCMQGCMVLRQGLPESTKCT
ncbi:hypothetical protein GGR53DRAFT_489415 [Hypoxylon sp. FL1150]|nr:hypothetical protein GGR53DRAFT_489415 [Hypoxylon sp. FL1150]